MVKLADSIRTALLAGLCIWMTLDSAATAKTLKASASYQAMVKAKPHSRAELLKNARYKEAVTQFGEKNYAAALNGFQALDSSGYCCDLVHYYIAQCYQLTNQTVAAQMHYNWVLSYSKDNYLKQCSEYANQTLAYYSNHRSYGGQGNNFALASTGGVRFG